MKVFILILLAFVPAIAVGQDCTVNVIPRPASIRCDEGAFEINKDTRIVAVEKSGEDAARTLNGFLKNTVGFDLKIDKKAPSRNYIALLPPARNSEHLFGPTPGWYALRVEPERIRIEGSEAGHFYGVQTLVQMLPAAKTGKITIPSSTILDRPRFSYRGIHLDVARHFQPVSFVKKFIDLMSQYKFNQFHWHLTEDQGWRIEIKKYPKLTEIGSVRPETMKEKNFSPYVGDGVPHGGFYNQEEIKEVVAYAKARHINVIPEIELPGHASAALAAYPQFGCKADYKYKVQTTWGIFKEVFCPTDETFKFLEDVLEETIALFPDSPYIHIGGDEVLKDHWKESAFVQELKKRENLKDEHEVQSYFVRRIEKFLNSKGKKMIGWDEILEGGLAPNATVMSWRGMKGGIEAAKSRHDVIMTPTDFAYLDYGQGDPNYEPINIGNHVPLEKVYSFEPVPKELSADEAKYVIGGQGNIWTEYMKTPDKIEYMALPRMLALAEVLWSPKEDKDFADFSKRLVAQLPRLDRQNVNYRIPEPAGLRNIATENEKVSIELQPAAGTRIYYTTDGSAPGDKSPTYEKPLGLSLKLGEPLTLKTVTVNAAGRKSMIYAATLLRDKMLESVNLGQTKSGVSYELTVPNDNPELKTGRLISESKSILLGQFEKQIDLKKPYAVSYDGYVSVPADGIYEFQIDSTWDSTLIVGDRKIIDDVGTAEKKIRFAIVPLKAGLHKISFRYNHRGGPGDLALRMGLKGQGLRRVYGGELFR